MASETQELCEVVAAWLLYKSHTGLRNTIVEASLAVPIAEFLTAKHGSEIESERDHPKFKSNSKGRPKQIDFVRVKRGERAWHAAYECKYGNNSGLGAVANDICRLACLAHPILSPVDKRYFLFAGKLSEKSDNLLSKGINTGLGKRADAFKGLLAQGNDALGKEGRLKINLAEAPAWQYKAFRKFTLDYGAELPSVIVTSLVGWAVSMPFGCAVWEIKSARGSMLLNSAQIKEKWEKKSKP